MNASRVRVFVDGFELPDKWTGNARIVHEPPAAKCTFADVLDGIANKARCRCVVDLIPQSANVRVWVDDALVYAGMGALRDRGETVLTSEGCEPRDELALIGEAPDYPQVSQVFIHEPRTAWDIIDELQRQDEMLADYKGAARKRE